MASPNQASTALCRASNARYRLAPPFHSSVVPPARGVGGEWGRTIFCDAVNHAVILVGCNIGHHGRDDGADKHASLPQTVHSSITSM